MKDAATEDEIREAIQDCANEPVHIPGIIQSIGMLLGADLKTGEIRYASANVAETLGWEISENSTKTVVELLGLDLWHSLTNLIGLKDFAQRRYFVGPLSHEGSDYSVHVTKGGDCMVLEIEHAAEQPSFSPEMLREQTFLINQIQSCSDEQSLFDLTTRMLRHVTGFDRVMIYRFDADWNGEILSEARKAGLTSFEGLRFPHWDIPKQARDIMARIQLRLIADPDAVPIPIVPKSDAEPPLDISLAQLRGASPVHLQYLKNMGTMATMTLSIVLDGELWGMISFHHGTPKVSSPSIRQILSYGVLPVFCLKLGLLRGDAEIGLSRALEILQTDIQQEVERGTSLNSVLAQFGPQVCETLNADGLVISTGSQYHDYGIRPSQAALEHIISITFESDQGFWASENLSETMGAFKAELGEIAGVLATVKSEGRCLLLFRNETTSKVSWAGNPDKIIEKTDGPARLQPRGSFSRYLEETTGRSRPWSDLDRHLARQLWPLLSAIERQAFMASLTRQRGLLIDELNHRVRNILALVKSVSQQASKDQGSLESYSQALESRIMALAAAHDFGAGSAARAVPFEKIVALELAPYDAPGENRFELTGRRFSIRADLAPIFALVIHELATNAVKYGALSNASGRVTINSEQTKDGIQLVWQEFGGPKVTNPNARGFGTTLIQQAVPYEMSGTASIMFAEGGVIAEFFLPNQTLDFSNRPELLPAFAQVAKEIDLTEVTKDRMVLIIEDNFMIASAMKDEFSDIGLQRAEVCADNEAAMAFLEKNTPGLAVLDVNLGNGQTSEVIATELLGRGVPTFFVTGYGDTLPLPHHLASVPVLTKPVSQADLRECLGQLLG